MLLAFGGHEPYLGFLVEHVPGFGLFRDANRYKTLAALCFAVPVGHGVHALVTDRRAPLVALALLAAIALHALYRGKVPVTFWLVAGRTMGSSGCWSVLVVFMNHMGREGTPLPPSSAWRR